MLKGRTMTPLAIDSAIDSGGTLVCELTPSGRIDVRPGAPEEYSGQS